MSRTKAVLISVGGSLEPLLYTLNHLQPEVVIFFASSESKKKIPEIIQNLNYTPEATEQIITPSAEILDECYRNLIQELAHKLEILKINPRELVVDYTGGTKTMSAALMLATIESGCAYSYIGGLERNKGGVGIVIDGKEKAHYFTNPYDELAVLERKKANLLFNKARYTSALDAVTEICEKVTEDKKSFYQMWQEIILAYQLWDNLDYQRAENHLEKGYQQLKLLIGQSNELTPIKKKIENNINFLRKVVNRKNKELLIYDLISNSIRRAELENKYDDAVARLYRAIEKMAQIKLKYNYKIDTSNVILDQLAISSSAKEKYLKYKDSKDNKVKLPLFASYSLLSELGDSLGRAFFKVYDMKLKPLLDTRNHSILAHGDKKIEKDTYEKMLEVVIEFGEIDKTKIPHFPELNL